MARPTNPKDVPEPTEVWMSRPGFVAVEQGRLRITPFGLTFEGAAQRLDIPAQALRQVRKGLGTPVLTVAFEEDGERREAAFFFAPPPPHESPTPNPAWMPGRGLERTAAIMSLRAANSPLRPLVTQWLRAVRGLKQA